MLELINHQWLGLNKALNVCVCIWTHKYLWFSESIELIRLYFLFLQFHGVMIFSHRNNMKVYNVDVTCNCNVTLANIWLSGPCGDLGQDTFSWENWIANNVGPWGLAVEQWQEIITIVHWDQEDIICRSLPLCLTSKIKLHSFQRNLVNCKLSRMSHHYRAAFSMRRNSQKFLYFKIE